MDLPPPIPPTCDKCGIKLAYAKINRGWFGILCETHYHERCPASLVRHKWKVLQEILANRVPIAELWPATIIISPEEMEVILAHEKMFYSMHKLHTKLVYTNKDGALEEYRELPYEGKIAYLVI